MLIPVGESGSLESVEPLLGFVPGCLKLFAAGGRRRQTLFDAGDRVVTRWTGSGTHQAELMGIAPTGKQVMVTGIWIHRIAGDRIVESWNALVLEAPAKLTCTGTAWAAFCICSTT
jgi:hypothetical protein